MKLNNLSTLSNAQNKLLRFILSLFFVKIIIKQNRKFKHKQSTHSTVTPKNESEIFRQKKLKTKTE